MRLRCLIFVQAAMMAVLTAGCIQGDAAPDKPTIDPITYDGVEEVITLDNRNSVIKRQGLVFYEGDICLTPQQYDNLCKYGNIFDSAAVKPSVDRSIHPVTNLPVAMARNVGVYPTGYNLWAMVRFVYDSSLTADQKEAIRTALLRIQSNTNVRFYNATGQPTRDSRYNVEYPYINFTYIGNQDTSSSYVGRIGGKQNISLATFAFYPWNTSVIEHEICHALGMFHEQCRNDRDNYVTVNFANLTDKGKANFNKQTANYYYLGAYDFNSVMGYGSYTTSTSIVKDPTKPMYTKKDGTSIIQGSRLSNMDRAWLNYFYLPFVARSDTYYELEAIVYDVNNVILTEAERLQLQAQLNNGNPTPPPGGRIANQL